MVWSRAAAAGRDDIIKSHDCMCIALRMVGVHVQSGAQPGLPTPSTAQAAVLTRRRPGVRKARCPG